MIRQFLINIVLPDWARWYAVDELGEVWVFVDWTKTLHKIERAA